MCVVWSFTDREYASRRIGCRRLLLYGRRRLCGSGRTRGRRIWSRGRCSGLDFRHVRHFADPIHRSAAGIKIILRKSWYLGRNGERQRPFDKLRVTIGGCPTHDGDLDTDSEFRSQICMISLSARLASSLAWVPSHSIPTQARFKSGWQAMAVVPPPRKGSRAKSPSFVEASRQRSTRATGFWVGCLPDDFSSPPGAAIVQTVFICLPVTCAWLDN